MNIIPFENQDSEIYQAIRAMRQFYQAFPIWHALRAKSWHSVPRFELIALSPANERIVGIV
jgi:hypothetical protein